MTDSTAPAGLCGTDRPLVELYDALLVDIDGVVQLGPDPVTGAAEALTAATAAGVRVAFVTNNASRTPADVAASLASTGVSARDTDVVTSAIVATRLLADAVGRDARVLVVGGAGLSAAVTDAGLTAVASADDEPVAVIQGWGPDVAWKDLAEACLALRAGVPWYVTNLDRTLPSPRGPLPGSGSLVAVLTTATDRRPDVVAGKPEPELFTVAARQLGASSPLVCGDRLDTDIAGARAAGLPALAVLTGIATPRQVLAADPDSRPTYLGRDLSALGAAHPGVDVADGQARCRDAVVTSTGDVSGEASGDGLDALRAAVALAWSGALPEERYGDVLRRLGLD